MPEHLKKWLDEYPEEEVEEKDGNKEDLQEQEVETSLFDESDK